MSARLLSTAYLPPVEYFAFFTAENVSIECCEHYQKQSYRNRTAIVNGNGVMNLIIPTVHDFRMGIVSDVRIDYATPWQRTHWKTIESAYNNTPFFLYYKDALKPFYESKTEFLLDFNMNLTKTVLKLLKINVDIERTTSFTGYGDNDLRVLIQPKQVRKDDYPLRLTIPYYQVFEEKFGYLPNLSIIDLLFNIGPQAVGYLKEIYSGFKNIIP